MPRVGTTMAIVVHLKNAMVPYCIASGRCKVRVMFNSLDCLYQCGKWVCVHGINKMETLQNHS